MNKLQYLEWKPHQHQIVSFGSLIQVELESGDAVFNGGENQSTQKNLGEDKNQQKTQPKYMYGTGACSAQMYM